MGHTGGCNRWNMHLDAMGLAADNQRDMNVPYSHQARQPTLAPFTGQTRQSPDFVLGHTALTRHRP
jgi:hypothetical protein